MVIVSLLVIHGFYTPQSLPSGPLSAFQLELLKLYSTKMTETELRDLKRELAHYFARKAIAAADRAWDEKGLSNEDMDEWLDA